MVLQGKAEGVGLSLGGGMVTVTLEPGKWCRSWRRSITSPMSFASLGGRIAFCTV